MRVFISLMLLLGTAAATQTTAGVDSAKKSVQNLIEGIVKTAQKAKKIDETVHSSLKNEEKSFEQAAKKQPLLLFKALPQRACPWSKYKKGTDWKFGSMKSDDKEECARSCVATKGCTGFEVGPHTSSHYNFISYCALWFNKKCSDEKNMLRLNPKGYVAATYVMVKTVTVDVKTEEKTPLGTIEVEAKKTFQPDESKKHYQSVHTKEKSGTNKSTENKKHTTHHKEKPKKTVSKVASTTTDLTSPVSRFEEFPQLACDFSQYKKGSDWKYTKDVSGDVESCATVCLNTDDCNGFEIGIDAHIGQYCAIWKSGACSTEKSMVAVPADAQTVSTFVLANYHNKKEGLGDGFAVVFLIACACALLISLLLVGCICYRVLSRVCCRRAEINGTVESVVAGELVKATVLHGIPSGQRVDVVVVRGEAVDQK